MHTLRQLGALTLNDLRQRVRDRSVLVFGVLVPLALMGVFNLVFGDAETVQLEPVTVAVSVPEDDDLAATLVGVVDEATGEDLPVQVIATDAEDVDATVAAGEAELGLVVPQGFSAAVREGRAVSVEAFRSGTAELEEQVVLSVVDGVLQQLAAGAEAAAAAAMSGVPGDRLEAVARRATTGGPTYTLEEGATASEQLDNAGALVAGQAGLFLLFTVGFGVLALIIEREQGTLARLRSMPVAPWLLVAAKAASSFVLGVVATGVLLTAGALLFDTGFGPVPWVALLVVCAVAAATSVMFLVVKVAATSEQAGVAQAITALVLGVAGGAFFPVTATGALGALLDLNPIAAFTRGLGISAGGGGLADLATPIATMLGFAALMVLLARVVPARRAAS